MTSLCLITSPVEVVFFRDAADIYGADGLRPSTAGAVGVDLRACLDGMDECVVSPGRREGIPSGLAIAPQAPGFAGFVYSRSGLGAVKGLVVAQGVGLIDPDYRGEIRVFLLNTGTEPYTVKRGERIAQIVFQPYFRPDFRLVDALDATERGAGGFGHTGR